ncbi:WEB family protein At1g12150-like [Diospyros lotus]|uniref:WEB family protein At1g12150-like n=1 Tax=Diospyros lotus TaxID=55363 RepID=UPI0022528BF6|nr:WEB family protein At1g12150-like [Diospyros lotus]
MFGFSIRTRQNAAASPKIADSPGAPVSPRTVATPIGMNSPKPDQVGEIDTRAPFQSVKAAVSLFAEGTSPKERPVLKKSKTIEERVLEKESQLHLALKELDKYKEQLKSTETTKAQAQREIEKANRTLQELTCKLETASESKQEAIAATESAKSRAKQLEEDAKLSRAQLDGGSWKQDVDSEREQYKASAGELIAAKQELTNVRQDFDAALELKLSAFQESADAQHTTKVNRERVNDLSKEIATMRETLSQVKLATVQTQEEQEKVKADRETHLQSHIKATEEVEKKIQSLKEEESELRLHGNLEEKLEETTEAIAVLQEQLKNVRESDLHSLQAATCELEDAKNAHQAVLQEGSSVQRIVDSLKLELDEVKRELSEMKEKEAESETAAKRLRDEIERSKVELEEALVGESKQVDASDQMRSRIQQLSTETENARHEMEKLKKSSEDLMQEVESARNEAKETEEKLVVALKEAEKAQEAAKLASDQIHSMSSSSSSSNNNNNNNITADDDESAAATNNIPGDKIKLSVEDFESLSRKVEEMEKMAEAKVGAAMAEVEESNARERETVEKLEASLKEMEEIKAATEDAVKRAEMAEAAKVAVEEELHKWREQEEEHIMNDTINNGGKTSSSSSSTHPQSTDNHQVSSSDLLMM